MPPDATETKRRLLEAAVAEFATYGLAGARVDRIAETARANKRSIYMHFGTKEELFDRVLGDSMQTLAQSITFDAEDLPAYAGDLFDRLEKWPHIRRLYQWAGLERQQPVDVEADEYRRNADAVAAAQRAGRVRDDIPAAELLAMVVALAISWETASWSLRVLNPRPSGTGRRESVTAAVASLVRTPPVH